MPEYLATELINMNIAKWSGTLDPHKEEFLRSRPGMYEDAFCKHNQVIAAKQVLKGEFSCYPVFSKNKEVQMEKMIDAAKILLTEKPLTIDETQKSRMTTEASRITRSAAKSARLARTKLVGVLCAVAYVFSVGPVVPVCSTGVP